MKIVIIGAGQVGGTLAEHLAGEANDISVVDLDERRLRELQDRFDIRTVQGMGFSPGCSDSCWYRRRRHVGGCHQQ